MVPVKKEKNDGGYPRNLHLEMSQRNGLLEKGVAGVPPPSFGAAVFLQLVGRDALGHFRNDCDFQLSNLLSFSSSVTS